MLKYFLETNKYDPIFMRNSFRRYIYIAFLVLLTNYAIIAYLYYNFFTIAPTTYFATTTDGRIIDLHPE